MATTKAAPDERLPKGIRKRGSTYLINISHNGQRIYETHQTLAAALERRKEIHMELLRGAVGREPQGRPQSAKGFQGAQGGWTLQQAYDFVMESHPPVGWKGTRGEPSQVYAAQELLFFFGADRSLNSIRTDDLDEFVAHCRAKKYSPATINRKLSCLSKLFTAAARKERVTHRPSFPRQHEGEGRLRYLTEEEEAAFIRVFEQRGRLDIMDSFIVLIDTGLRPSELWEVKGADLDLKKGLIMVFGKEGFGTKNGEFRPVPMTRRVRAIMERRLLAKGAGAVLFPYNNHWLYFPFISVRDSLKLGTDVVPYTLRHTCASRLVQRGVGIAHIQKWLGHKTIKITLRYAKLGADDLINAASVLEKEAAE